MINTNLFFVTIIISSFIIFLNNVEIQAQNGNSSNNDDDDVNKLSQYWNWWLNVIEDFPIEKLDDFNILKDKPIVQHLLSLNQKDENFDYMPKCSMGINTTNQIVFLLNPFEKGTLNFDCKNEQIPKGYSILFPAITSFCSRGDAGLYNMDFKSVRNCALNLDRGNVKVGVFLDDKKVTDVVINNKYSFNDLPQLRIDNSNIMDFTSMKNNLPANQTYYKQIFSKEFVDLIVTDNATISVPNGWEHPTEFTKNPIRYESVLHCDCIIVNTLDLSKGDHILEYVTIAKSGKNTHNLDSKEWNFESKISYAITIS